jgi:hypothetical protein
MVANIFHVNNTIYVDTFRVDMRMSFPETSTETTQMTIALDQDRFATLSPRTAALIKAALDAPKTHVVVTTYRGRSAASSRNPQCGICQDACRLR